MAKAVVLEYLDVDPGVDDNNVTLLAKVLFVGATVPNSPVIDQGSAGNGIPIPWNVTGTLAGFSNNVETALVNRATALGFTMTAADVFFPSFNRGT
jgi:hypothetical protein